MTQKLSAERFLVTYRLQGNQMEACAKAKDICYEQTVEFPEGLIQDGFIRNEIVGNVESFGPYKENYFDVVISYSVQTAFEELTQLLNVIFGNISIKKGIRVEDIEIPKRQEQKLFYLAGLLTSNISEIKEGSLTLIFQNTNLIQINKKEITRIGNSFNGL